MKFSTLFNGKKLFNQLLIHLKFISRQWIGIRSQIQRIWIPFETHKSERLLLTKVLKYAALLLRQGNDSNKTSF